MTSKIETRPAIGSIIHFRAPRGDVTANPVQTVTMVGSVLAHPPEPELVWVGLYGIDTVMLVHWPTALVIEEEDVTT